MSSILMGDKAELTAKQTFCCLHSVQALTRPIESGMAAQRYDEGGDGTGACPIDHRLAMAAGVKAVRYRTVVTGSRILWAAWWFGSISRRPRNDWNERWN